MELEALYLKLYDKYAAEELIEHLRSENEELRGQISDLRSEVASIRLAKDKQLADYQRLLMEESKKYEALSEEIEKLRKVHQGGNSSNSKENRDYTPEDNQFMAISYSLSRRVTRKRSRLDSSEEKGRSAFREKGEDNSVVKESSQNFCKQTTSGEPPECLTKTDDRLGILEKNGSVLSDNQQIQALFEYVLGMKLSADYQTGRASIFALHQSSYSFSLTWVSKADEEEAELLYHVLSLGTFERVAPEWMREDIMFTTHMCSNFFQRVSHVIKLHH